MVDDKQNNREEKQFVIPLRKEFQKVPNYRKAKKAVNAVREFIIKNTKVDNVKIGKYLNEKILSRGRKNPPPRVKVKVLKEDDFIRVELPEFPFEKSVEKEKKKEKSGLQETKDKILNKKEDKKEKELKKEKKESQKEVEESKKEEKLDLSLLSHQKKAIKKRKS